LGKRDKIGQNTLIIAILSYIWKIVWEKYGRIGNDDFVDLSKHYQHVMIKLKQCRKRVFGEPIGYRKDGFI